MKDKNMKKLKITIGQLNPNLGDMSSNIAMMLAVARDAVAAEADVVVFPELSLTGYSPGDLLDSADFVNRLELATEKLLEATKQTPTLTWIVGLPVPRHRTGGKRFFNAVQVIINGEVRHEQHKQLLPTYGVFDEFRHFEPGATNPAVVSIAGVRVGLLICEDQWNDNYSEYKVNPFDSLVAACPDVLISINASPSHVGKRQMRHNMLTKACARHSRPLLYVAQVGGHDQLIYDGASFAVSSKGAVVFEAARFVSASPTLTFDVDAGEFRDRDGAELPPVPKDGLPDMEFYRQQLVLGIRDYTRRCGFTKALIGSSGGIDSALTMALAVEALGPENVEAITLPSVYSSEGSVSDSVDLCRNLGIKLHTMPIKDIVNQFSAIYAQSVGAAPSGLALENLQSQIRATMLMTHSRQHGHLLLTTGNKSEISVGYFTLGGDGLGGLCVPGDLYKTEVFELCRHINKTAGREVIPVAIIEKPPSAELAPDQKDTDSLPPYDVLDPILKVLIEGDRLEKDEHALALAVYDDLEQTDAGRAMLMRVKGLIARSEYKRRQAPPILRVRALAFGAGRQVPITARQF